MNNVLVLKLGQNRLKHHESILSEHEWPGESFYVFCIFHNIYNFPNNNLRVLITRAAAEEAPGRKPGDLRTRAWVQLVYSGSWRKTKFLVMNRIHIRCNMPILFGSSNINNNLL